MTNPFGLTTRSRMCLVIGFASGLLSGNIQNHTIFGLREVLMIAVFFAIMEPFTIRYKERRLKNRDLV